MWGDTKQLYTIEFEYRLNSMHSIPVLVIDCALVRLKIDVYYTLSVVQKDM